MSNRKTKDRVVFWKRTRSALRMIGIKTLNGYYI